MRHDVKPPKLYDVGRLILEYRDRLPAGAWDDLARESKWLRMRGNSPFMARLTSYRQMNTRVKMPRAITAADLAITLAGFVIKAEDFRDSLD